MSNSVKWAIPMAVAAACVFAIAHGLRDPRVDDVWVDDSANVAPRPSTVMWYESKIGDLEAQLRQCQDENVELAEAVSHWRDRPWPDRLKGGDGK